MASEKKKILTVIIPTYNMEALLDRCLSSLIIEDSRLRSMIEGLVIIDGATDQSSSIAHRYAETHPDLFRVIDKENGNYGSCINRGLNEASGKYVKVLDADDLFNTQALEQFVGALGEIDADMVVSSGVNVTTTDEETFRWKFNYQSGELYPIEQLHHVWIHDVTHKTAILKEIGYRQTEKISYSDEEWVFYPMFHIKNFYALNIKLYCYTVGREGQTMNPQNWKRAAGNEMLVSRKMFEYLISCNWEMGRASNYIREKTRDRMAGFYSKALLDCHLYADKELVDFDLYLQHNCPDIYQSLNDLCAPNRHFCFHFVKYWRANNYQVRGLLNKFRLYDLWMKFRSLK